VPIADFMLKIEKEKTAFLALLEQAGLEKEDNEFQMKIIENDYLQTRNSYDRFNFYHTQQHPVVPEDYYEPIKKMDISDEESFMNDKSYMNMVIENWRLKSADALKNDPNFSIIEYTKLHVKDLKSTKIKDYITSMLFKQMNAKNENLEKDYIEIMGMLTAEDMKEKLTSRYKSVFNTKPEMTSIGFDYENHKGGKTALKDLEGKLVYIEVWATWCGPCIKEMPYLTEIIKEYKDNENIVFVNISIDAINEYDKWRTMVPAKNVGGIQLLADNSLESEFMKYYSVGLIPRSIMLDAEGKIISQHAPRPSSKDIRTFIDENLNKTTRNNTLIKTEKIDKNKN
ncbi:MAG: TlpA family protein disulfide reductase, partial [Flavobacteriales bacterium]|nr:TlpA family protein disulfide reductase [Flavobacteriales bacterium]